jgi:hypothetical protein
MFYLRKIKQFFEQFITFEIKNSDLKNIILQLRTLGKIIL